MTTRNKLTSGFVIAVCAAVVAPAFGLGAGDNSLFLAGGVTSSALPERSHDSGCFLRAFKPAERHAVRERGRLPCSGARRAAGPAAAEASG